MGQWETERGHGGDGIADYLDVEIHPEAEDMREMKVSDLDSSEFETIPNRGQIKGMNP